jgi:hypothetical protein
MARIDAQSSAKLAEGGSKATGSAAIGVQTSHNASGICMCAYWIGLPSRARPAHTAAVEPLNRRRTRRGCPRSVSTVADSPSTPLAAGPPTPLGACPKSRRSPRASGGGSGRSSVRARKSPDPNTTAEKLCMSAGRSDDRPASRTSISAPLGACTPRKLAGSVAASFAMTKSPGRKRSTSFERRACVRPPRASTTRSFASRGRWTGRSAAIIPEALPPPRAARAGCARPAREARPR